MMTMEENAKVMTVEEDDVRNLMGPGIAGWHGSDAHHFGYLLKEGRYC